MRAREKPEDGQFTIDSPPAPLAGAELAWGEDLVRSSIHLKCKVAYLLRLQEILEFDTRQQRT